MALPRSEVHNELVDIYGKESNVYFQPPEKIKLKYPCIVYKLSGKDNKKADNINYIQRNRYMVTIIDEDPDSEKPHQLEQHEYCSFDREFQLDNLNHWVFTMYR